MPSNFFIFFLFSPFPWSLCSPCPCIIVVPQVAIFSYGTDINGMTAQRKSSREGATVRLTLPSFLLLIKANTPVNEQRECVCESLGEADDTAALQDISMILAGIAVFHSWCRQCWLYFALPSQWPASVICCKVRTTACILPWTTSLPKEFFSL